MSNIIFISEKNNRLFIEEEYTPIVCGNSNYYLEFIFSEEWKKCETKTAMFLVENKKTLVTFEGTTCKVPVLPNGSYVLVSLLSSPNEGEQLATTRVRLRLEPNQFSEPYKEDEVQKRYASQIHGIVNSIKNGELSVLHAETSNTAGLANHSNTADYAEHSSDADYSLNSSKAETANFAESAKFAETSTIARFSETQVDLTSDQTILGIKNFKDNIQKQSVALLNANEVSNPNLFLNGNFIVNQRGLTTYTGACYSVDRWYLGSNSSLSVSTNGIIFSKSSDESYLKYHFEDKDFVSFLGKNITVSMSVSNAEIGASYKFIVNTDNDSLEEIGIYSKESEIVFKTFCIPTTSNSLSIQIHPLTQSQNTTITIHYLKAEVGVFSTSFTPPNYSDELLKCQRYFYKTDSVLTSYSNAGGAIFFNINCPTEPRSGSLKLINRQNAYLIGHGSYLYFEILDIYFILREIRGNQISIEARHSSGRAFCEVYGVTYLGTFIFTDSLVEIDCEIY